MVLTAALRLQPNLSMWLLVRFLSISFFIHSTSLAAQSDEPFVISKSEYERILNVTHSIRWRIVLTHGEISGEQRSYSYSDLIKMYDTAMSDKVNAEQVIREEEARKRGEWELVEDRPMVPENERDAVFESVRSHLQADQTMEDLRRAGKQKKGKGKVEQQTSQDPNTRVVVENGRVKVHKRIPHDVRRFGFAEKQREASAANANEIKSELDSIESEMKSRSVGTLVEHLERQTKTALEARKAIVNEAEASSIFELIDQIDRRLQAGDSAQKDCDSMVNDWLLVHSIRYEGSSIYHQTPLSVSSALSEPQVQLIKGLKRKIRDESAQLVSSSFARLEPQPLSTQEVSHSAQLLDGKAVELQALSFCHGVLSATCVQSYVKYRGGLAESSAAELEQELQIALDRASLPTKVLLFRDIRSLNQPVEPELLQSLSQDLVATFKTTPFDVLIAGIHELNGRIESDTMANMIRTILRVRNLDEAERAELLKSVKHILSDRPQEELLSVMIQGAAVRDTAFILDRYSKLPSKSQLALANKVADMLRIWRSAIVESAMSRSKKLKEVETAKNYFDPFDPSASSQFPLILASLDEDELNRKSELRAFVERAERVIPILQSGSASQRQLAIAVSELYLTGFGDTDSALRALEKIPAPIDSDFDEAFVTLPAALFRILEVEGLRVKRQGARQADYQKFVTGAYQPALDALEIDSLTDEQRMDLRNFALLRSQVDSVITDEAQSLESELKNRVQRIDILSKRWVDQYKAGPREWLKGFDLLVKEVSDGR